MNISGFFRVIGSFFSSPKLKAVKSANTKAAIDAEPIVSIIASMVPNRTFQQIVGAYEHYAVPFLKTESQLTDPAMQGLALRDLAVTVLKKNHQDKATQVLNAAVELALAAARAK